MSETRLHASSVALDGRGVLIIGKSGSGKSGLALQLMAFGAMLVSDDQILLIAKDGWPFATAPDATRGMIEARGVGLLAAKSEPARVVLAVNLDQCETDRLPPDRTMPLPGRDVPLLHKAESPYFAASILQYLKAGKVNSDAPQHT